MIKRPTPDPLNSENSEPMHDEPLAIVGIGCRLPGGVDDVDAFWRLLSAGEDAVIDVPADRWDRQRFSSRSPNKVGKMQAQRGGFLRRPVDLFDASFFGMSPREAARLDPQQRLLMEAAWEAMEDAGQRPSELVGSQTGVFMGGFMLDSLLHQLSRDNLPLVESHTATGLTMTMLSARLAYFFDLRGPTVSIDTACSSSLVALHYACTSIWRGECQVALCGGVNVMLAPAMSIALSKGKLTSPDGRSKPFDASANGYGRGEGAGMVLIRPLSEALRRGDLVYALVRGTAVNQDGHSEHGITHPSKDAQIAVLRTAYARAGVQPTDVHYVEAHGTGTKAGDVTETASLGAVIGAGRGADERFVIGSVKGNVGHTEGAAGVTGLIKAALSLHHQQIAPNVHFNTPNPEIAFDALRMRVPVQPEPWPRGATPRYAGVNSFGYGGTNAHVVLQEAPQPAARALQGTRKPWFLPVSARSEAALKAQAGRYADHLETLTEDVQVEDFIYSASMRRDHLEHRAGWVAESREELVQGLRAAATGAPHPSYVSGHVSTNPPKVAWVFTGMGPQSPGMAQELMHSEPAFREAVEALDAAFKTHGGWSLVEELMRPEAASRMDRAEIAMSCNFAVQVGLTALWRSYGFQPDVVVGHSVGEMGAAFTAGALSLPDAARLAFFRSSMITQAVGTGVMLATGLDLQGARDLLRGQEHLVSVAAINGPRSITLSGQKAALEKIDAELEARGLFHKFLRVDVPYHSPQMDPLTGPLAQALQPVKPLAPSIPLFSTVTQQRIDGATLDGAYWVRNLREPVFFSDVFAQLLAQGCTHFVEVGPHPVLASAMSEFAKDAGRNITCMPSMQRKKAERKTMLAACRQLYLDGMEPRWENLTAPQARYTRLPTYAWQRERHWVESAASASFRLPAATHPLLGRRLQTPTPTWEAEIGDGLYATMEDHRVGGEVLFPASGYMEAALALLQQWRPNTPWCLQDIAFSDAFVLGGDDAAVLRSSLDERGARFALHSRNTEDEAAWRLSSTGRFVPSDGVRPANIDVDGLRRAMTQTMQGHEVYANLKKRGYAYGPLFQQVTAVHLNSGKTFVCDIAAPAGLSDAGSTYTLHPATFDACLHSALALLPADGDTTYLPVGVRRFVCHEPLPARVTVVVHLGQAAANELRVDLRICTPEGRVLADVEGLCCRAVGTAQDSLPKDLTNWTYTFAWEQKPRGEPRKGAGETWLLLSDGNSDLDASLSQHASSLGVKIIMARHAQTWRAESPESYAVCFDSGDDIRRLFAAVEADAPTKIVSLLDANRLDASAAVAERIGTDGIVRISRLVQQLDRLEWKTKAVPQLVVVTRGAETHPDDRKPQLGRSSIAGFMRTVLNEHVNFHARVVDIDDDSPAMDALCDTLLADADETEMLLRGANAFARRLRRVLPQTTTGRTPRWVSPHQALVRAQQTGFVESSRPSVGNHQVLVQVHAAHWRRKADASMQATLVSGTVLQVGSAVRQFAEGACVMAFVPTDAASQVLLDETHVLAKPAKLNHETAAGLQALCTMHQALRLCGAGADDVVVIINRGDAFTHAAIGVAQHVGASLVVVDAADAGHDVRERVREMTHGRGADVLICQTAQDWARASSLLAVDGCVVNLTGNASLFNDCGVNVQCPPTAEIGASRRQLRVMTETLRDVLGLVEREAYRPSQPTVKDFADAGQHADFEKCVVRVSPTPVQTVHTGLAAVARADGSYIITGGLGGLGLQMASWLARQGAGHIILLGRQGAATPEAKAGVESLKALGTRVTVAAADVSNGDTLPAILDEALRQAPPLRGVVHAASTFGTKFIGQFDANEMRSQMGAKAVGAYNLHRYTEHKDLDFFVLISSFSGQIGAHGQSVYAAANAFLDGLCVYRRATGLAATSINFGAIEEVGILRNNADYGAYLAQNGALGMKPGQVLEALDYALTRGMDRLSVTHMDWVAFFAGWPAMRAAPAFASVYQEVMSHDGKQAATADGPSFATMLAELNVVQRTDVVVQKLRELCATVFGTTPEQVDPQTPLQKMGLDSLMASQLRDKIEAELKLEVRVMSIVRGPPIVQLAGTLLSQLEAPGEASSLSSLDNIDRGALENALKHVDGLDALMTGGTSGSN